MKKDAAQLKGTLVVISAPSGGGKTTVIEHLVEHLPDAVRLVTTTSRPPRDHEQDGVDYFFLTKSEFEKKIAHDELVEYVAYAGEYYGVDRDELQRALINHEYVFAPVDVRGKEALEKEDIPVFSIFLVPENTEVLKHRLERRQGMTDESIQERLALAEREIAAAGSYDAQVVNREGFLAETLEAIISALPAAGRKTALDKAGRS